MTCNKSSDAYMYNLIALDLFVHIHVFILGNLRGYRALWLTCRYDYFNAST